MPDAPPVNSILAGQNIFVSGEGLCACGCGQQTPIAKTTNPSRGLVRGEPCRFARGHGRRVHRGSRRWDDPESRFWSYVTRAAEGCWEWTGSRDGSGYGRMHFHGKRLGAHRISWIIAHGSVPEGLEVCHRCDNPICVRPDHLFVGTHADNVRDCTDKGRNTLIENPDLWARGDSHWTRRDSESAAGLISAKRKAEWASGKRTAIRDAKGRILGTRMAP